MSQMPSAEDVGRYYDQFSQFFHIMWGDSIHVGYWPEESSSGSIPEAQVRFTELLISKVGLQSNQHLLDVGCGTGEPAIQLSRATGCQVTGVTVSTQQVEQARQRVDKAGLSHRVRFQLANAMQLPFEDQSFDAAWAFESLFHMSEPDRALREIHRCLRPGGRLLIANFTRIQPVTAEEMQFFHDLFCIGQLLSLEEHERSLRSAGFAVEEVRDLTRNIMNTAVLTRELLPVKKDELLRAFGAEALSALDAVWSKGVELGQRCQGYGLFVARKL